MVNFGCQLDFGAHMFGQMLFWVFLHDDNIWVSGLSEAVCIPHCGCVSSPPISFKACIIIVMTIIIIVTIITATTITIHLSKETSSFQTGLIWDIFLFQTCQLWTGTNTTDSSDSSVLELAFFQLRLRQHPQLSCVCSLWAVECGLLASISTWVNVWQWVSMVNLSLLFLHLSIYSYICNICMQSSIYHFYIKYLINIYDWF